MKIIVFGAGSLGSLLGGLLSRAHEVTLVGRKKHMEAIRRDGLRITGEIEVKSRPKACTETPNTADLALVCVKAFDTKSAAAALSECDLKTCLSVQNGLGNEAILEDNLNAKVLAGTCTYGAVHVEPGVVKCNGVGRVTLGSQSDDESATADRVGTAFEAAGIITTVASNISEQLWEKLAVNTGLNATTALSRLENGAILDGDARSVAAEATREVAAVARSDGIPLSNETAQEALIRVAEATAENTSSMHKDVLEERRTEVDAINGYVERRAEANGIDAPINATMARLLRAFEANRGLR